MKSVTPQGQGGRIRKQSALDDVQAKKKKRKAGQNLKVTLLKTFIKILHYTAKNIKQIMKCTVNPYFSLFFNQCKTPVTSLQQG